jgi:hypothetical protein
MSHIDAGGFPDRGTGYAYFDGTTWTVTDPTDRLEPVRTGWPNLEVLNGKEFNMSHDGAAYTVYQGFSNGIGLGSPIEWLYEISGSSAPVPEAVGETTGSIWPRIAVNGNSIHHISNFQPGTPAFDTAQHVNGVKAPTVYARSTDGGATWASNIGLPGYDSTRFLTGSADDYAIDANNGTIAIVYGGLGNDVSMWKSTDDGATFVHTYVDSFEYAPDYVVAPLEQELPTNDGSVSVVVDNNGKVHVSYAEGVVLHTADVNIPDGRAFQPGVIGLRYWTEGMDTAFSIPILVSDVDIDGDEAYGVGANTTAVGPTPTVGCRYGNNSILHKPSITYDVNGDIFIVFSLPRDNDTTFDGLSYRDVWIAAHKFEDAMETWTISNVTNTDFTEEVFANAARMSDEKIRIEYQEDFDPGTNLTNAHAIGDNNINYIEWSNPFITGIDPISVASGFSLDQNYPNPFTDQTQIQLTTKLASAVKIKIVNLLGENVWENNYNYAAGVHHISFDRSSLSNGVYFYTVTVGDESLTRKMIIE